MVYRLLVFTPSLEGAGGVLKLTLDMVYALNELRYDVEVFTFYNDAKKILKSLEMFSTSFKPRTLLVKDRNPITSLIDAFFPGRMIRFRRIASLLNFSVLKGFSDIYDLVIDVGSNLPSTYVDVTYIHFPATLGTMHESGITFRVYDMITSSIGKVLGGVPRKEVWTNSYWTKNIIEYYYPNLTGKIRVIHPAVEVEYFADVATNDIREKLIITISRFTPEKNLDKLIDVAKELPDYNFIMAGIFDKYSVSVVRKLIRKMKEEGVGNVELKFNISRDELKKLLGEALFYLHPPYAEHFGIAVAEAMASCCIPIVYRDGGSWLDLVKPVSKKLGYSEVTEVPTIIRDLERDSSEIMKLRCRALEHVRKFSYNAFKNRLNDMINSLINK